ncbi:MAG TPA: hypothetical protein VG737_01215, partial [Cyclobacteriaceae bacterium]|nr:hypothetical protein [Cyclobacteriaceae bacterium]
METKSLEQLKLQVNDRMLEGELLIPDNAKAIVIMAHGKENARLCPETLFIKEKLEQDGIATLLIDLLTSEEAELPLHTRLNLLTERLIMVTRQLLTHPRTRRMTVGYLGIDIGAAAALAASVEMGDRISAVVSQSGILGLAHRILSRV